MNPVENMELSDSQAAVLLDEGSRVLVAAGAGSGKTRLLVACFVQALVGDGVPLERLAAVTFTRKAAAELVTRIRATLQTCGRSDLVLSLDTANIGTIHSLCSRLLRERALDAGVDPAFAVLEAEAATVVKEQVCSAVWESAIEEADEGELGVLASQGAVLRRGIIPLYDRLRTVGHERPTVRIAPGPPEQEARVALAQAVEAALAAGGRLERRSASLTSDLLLLQRCLAWLEQREATRGPESASRPGKPFRLDHESRLAAGFFPSKRTQSMEPYFEPVRAALTSYRRCLGEAHLRPVVAGMNALLSRFHDRYHAYKRERGLLDFADLELHARALLYGDRDHKNLAAAAPPLRVMVDEFQDTNELQCAILEGLGASRLLMVGDERQSIYRFRGADVDVFRRRAALLDAQRNRDQKDGVHRLATNYRSSREILEFINRLFGHELFFGPRFVALQHGRRDETLADSSRAVVDVLVVDREPCAVPGGRVPLMQEVEARVVASRVRLLIDEEGYEPRQIVVLTPAQTHVALYQQALLARAVDVYVVGGKGYYAREEVSDVTALLRLLVNPHDDLALVAVLRSPLAGLSDDGLYMLGREARNSRARSLWEVIRAGEAPGMCDEDRGVVLDLVTRLGTLRRRIGRPGLGGLIDDAVSECGYDLWLLASADGKRRFANVRKLMRLADEYEVLEGPDLAGFVAAIQSLGNLSDREGSATTLAEGENVVRVMTIHQAKGLEFPAVVLAGLGSDVPAVAQTDFVVGDDGRTGVFLRGSQRTSYEPCDLCWGPADEIVAEQKARSQEEDVRLLYVAMTRAEERLVLVGARPGGDGLGGRRIGRICQALGIEALPPTGETVFIDGLAATVASVSPSDGGAEGTGVLKVEAELGAETRPTEAPPCFLQVDSAGLALQHMSFSAMAAYLRCPRWFYLERVLGLRLTSESPGGARSPISRGEVPETGTGLAEAASARSSALGSSRSSRLDPDSDLPVVSREGDLLDEAEAQAGREVGLLVHALLEKAALDGERPTRTSLRLMTREELGAATLSEAQLERALSLTQAFWRSPFAGKGLLVDATREAPFFFNRGGVLFSGLMDLTWQDGGIRRIVDYKTNALGQLTVAEAASRYELQATVYGLAGLFAGAEAVWMDFLFLERPEEPASVKFDTSEIPRMEEAIDELLADVRRGTFAAREGAHCTRCPVAEACSQMACPRAMVYNRRPLGE